MKRVLKAFPYLLIAAFCFFFVSKPVKHLRINAPSAKAFPVTEKKSFVVIIPSFNNSKWCERNIRSVFAQSYPNYRVIYIDDCSTDDTFEKVKRILAERGKEECVTLIRNKKNVGAMENLYQAIHSCDEREIAVLLDGDDWFAHEEVLTALNAAYADPDVWLTYGSYVNYPSYERGECAKVVPEKVFKRNALRTHVQEGFILSHLKTFYVSLFKQIALQDLLMNGKFLVSSGDQAIMLPMVEMAGRHARCLNEVLYVNNRANPLADDKVNFEAQQACKHYVWSLRPYTPLRTLPGPSALPNRADVLVFSYDRPLQLYAFLESFYAHASGWGEVQVLYRASDQDYVRAYEEVERAFPDAVFIRQSDEPHEDFKPHVLKAVFESPAEYVVFAVDDAIVKDRIDLGECARALAQTGAYGFYLSFGNHVNYSYHLDCQQGVPDSLLIGSGIRAWQFLKGAGEWKSPSPLDVALFAKSAIRQVLEKGSYVHPHSLESKWRERMEPGFVGLFYDNSRIVNLPLNLVHPSEHRYMRSYTTEELLSLFEEGMKIDVSPLYRLENRAVQIEYEPALIKRERR
jgi:glycosyltransferase involved in cell wall biosynthesis